MCTRLLPPSRHQHFSAFHFTGVRFLIEEDKERGGGRGGDSGGTQCYSGESIGVVEVLITTLMLFSNKSKNRFMYYIFLVSLLLIPVCHIAYTEGELIISTKIHIQYLSYGQHTVHFCRV